MMIHPDQASSLQGHCSVSSSILAVNDPGTGTGWQQSKQNWALLAVVGTWSRMECSDPCCGELSQLHPFQQCHSHPPAPRPTLRFSRSRTREASTKQERGRRKHKARERQAQSKSNAGANARADARVKRRESSGPTHSLEMQSAFTKTTLDKAFADGHTASNAPDLF